MQGRASALLLWLGLAPLAGCEPETACDLIEDGGLEEAQRDPDYETICVDVMVPGNECAAYEHDCAYVGTCAAGPLEDGRCCYVFTGVECNR